MNDARQTIRVKKRNIFQSFITESIEFKSPIVKTKKKKAVNIHNTLAK